MPTEKRNKERERLIELIGKQRQICKNAKCELCGYARFGGYPKCKDEKLADILLANGVKVEIPNNSVSMVDGHIEE